MAGRYTARDTHHRLLGSAVEVYDTATRRPQGAIYTGPYAEQRAQQRARELNAQEVDAREREGDR